MGIKSQKETQSDFNRVFTLSSVKIFVHHQTKPIVEYNWDFDNLFLPRESAPTDRGHYKSFSYVLRFYVDILRRLGLSCTVLGFRRNSRSNIVIYYAETM